MRKTAKALLAVAATSASLLTLASPANAGTGVGLFADCDIRAYDPVRPTSATVMNFSGDVLCNYNHNMAMQLFVERQRPDGAWETVAYSPRKPASSYTYTTYLSIEANNYTCVPGPLRTRTLVSDNGVHHNAYSTGSVRLCG